MKQKFSQLLTTIRKKPLVGILFGILFLPFSLVYMEVLAKHQLFGTAMDDKFLYTFFLSLATGFFLSFISMLLPGKPRRIFYITVLSVLAVWFSFHVTYHKNFHAFFSWQTLGQAKDVLQFWKEALAAMVSVWYIIAALFVPLVIVCLIGRFVVSDSQKNSIPASLASVVVFALLYFPIIITINASAEKTEEYTPYYYYTYIQSDLDQSFQYFGIVNVTRIDIKQLLFGVPVEAVVPFEPLDDGSVSSDNGSDTSGGQNADLSQQEGESYGLNVMDVDFEKAAKSSKNDYLKNMDLYFSSVEPTKKNQYTGMFKGKNLIFLTLEGFSYKAIDPELTPLLYKMSTEGFVFNNFYNTPWGGSTASGEYSNITGNFYTTANCLELSAKTYQPFALGNQLSAVGYKTLAYHNNTNTYYKRNKSHPNFGYKYKAVGNGMVLKSDCWPRSDKEMAEVTVGDYAGLDQPFHAYYMTFSGHAGYAFSNNAMSKRHRYDLPEKFKSYHQVLQGYFASQYEVELMLEVIVEKLEESGQLENTVFAMTPDHYPYPLNDDLLAQLYNLPEKNIRNNFDLYRNCFLIWTPSMKEPITVDAPCSTIDILPTLSNLFGLEYDSRLMMGSDILADGDHFALLKVNGWSWISAQGSYNANEKKFTPSKSCTLSKDEKSKYIKKMNKLVKAKTTYSKQLLDYDYYRHIFEYVRKEEPQAE